MGSSVRHAAFLNHKSQARQPIFNSSPIQWDHPLCQENSQGIGNQELLQRLLSYHLGTLSPLIGFGLEGSLSFGFHEVFKKLLKKLNLND